MTQNTADAGQLGAGQMAPNDPLSEVNRIAFAVRQIFAQYRGLVPVEVKAVHLGAGDPPAEATVDVQPLVSQIDGGGNVTAHGVVNGIPCSRMRAGPWAIIMDPAIGDFGFVMCADRDISNAIAQPGVVQPGSNRMWSLSDGIYVGEIVNGAPTYYLQCRSDGTFKLAAAGGFVLQTATNGSATITGDLNVTGNIKATQDVWAAAGSPATKVTLLGHISTNSTTPPTPGH